MKEREVLGYMLLLCKKAGMDTEQTRVMHDGMKNLMSEVLPNQAEKSGYEWFNSLNTVKKRTPLKVKPRDPKRVHTTTTVPIFGSTKRILENNRKWVEYLTKKRWE